MGVRCYWLIDTAVEVNKKWTYVKYNIKGLL